MAAVPTEGEAVVGARGLTGPAYAGHVFWDADVFALPFFAATCPSAARAMLEYRLRRLDAARVTAARTGRGGARFPWESAGSGFDVTPRQVVGADGSSVAVRTGEHEEHVVADVAWAAVQYVAWSGDTSFFAGPGAALVLDTARYWAGRIRVDAAGAHIDDVIGPDEYHERVADNAFTNVMARWNLRAAAALAESGLGDVSPDEVAAWRRVADLLVDGYDPGSGRYEQFAGFDGLEPLVMADVAEPPVAADELLGRDRVSRSQLIKQADVLMLHHLVPDETATGSLRPNLVHYGPRCAHGSSLSPAVHAALVARDGRPDDALPLLRMAARLDLDDLTGTTAGGLHLATQGGVWQALVQGFLGMRPAGWLGADGLTLDPRLPRAWRRLQVRLRYQGVRLQVTAEADALEVSADGPVVLRPAFGVPCRLDGVTARWERGSRGWRPA
jgi:trehalose/maltose hydrolase-like predicted phosphorylase